MLSIGGEVAVPKNVFELKEKSADILLIGTIKQLHDLVGKLNRHYPRVKKISNEISILLKSIQQYLEVKTRKKKKRGVFWKNLNS